MAFFLDRARLVVRQQRAVELVPRDVRVHRGGFYRSHHDNPLRPCAVGAIWPNAASAGSHASFGCYAVGRGAGSHRIRRSPCPPPSASSSVASPAAPPSPPRPSCRCSPRCRPGAPMAAPAAEASTAAAACPDLLQRQMPRLQDEKPQALCQYAGKVVLVVNTASFCGYTPQYKALESISARYADKGLVVLGFPSGDFGNQEYGSNKEIAEFCENTFNVKFPMFSKSSVAAGKADLNPLFADLPSAQDRRPSGTSTST
ncbi:glutathione peroxidase domain-containing protein [Ditylenchus destructor]|nr:glutathione peroxidase domain-containing protein [Ditylenchus destructor]